MKSTDMETVIQDFEVAWEGGWEAAPTTSGCCASGTRDIFIGEPTQDIVSYATAAEVIELDQLLA